MSRPPERSTPVRAAFAEELRQLRTIRGLSLSGLAQEIHFSRGYIGNVETGGKFPEAEFAELADRALRAGGTLLRAWREAHTEREATDKTRRLLNASLRDSELLADALDHEHDLAEIHARVEHLAVDYLASPAPPIMAQALELRAEVIGRLKTHDHRPSERADLFLAAGRLCGVLSYAALDLGHPDTAFTHTRAAWSCAEKIADNELRAWVRGTQSLIARFQTDYHRALDLILDGKRYAGYGTSQARILCGEAQCLANLGDATAANRTLDAAQDARTKIIQPDSLGGLFEFTETKQRYYAGSALIWLNGEPNAQRAAQEAQAAISRWQQEPPASRSLDDEALAHVYLGTARLQLGDLDGAMAAIRPILDLPP
jgi:transcriptional regulator with XRE-family HTH domain